MTLSMYHARPLPLPGALCGTACMTEKLIGSVARLRGAFCTHPYCVEHCACMCITPTGQVPLALMLLAQVLSRRCLISLLTALWHAGFGNGYARYGHLWLTDRPPIVASVLLADDVRVWKPAPSLQLLWTRHRLHTLHAIWSSAGKARVTGTAVDVRSVALRVLLACRKFMLHDWFRVGLRRSALGECPQWLLS